jgi:hypothetical protein
MSGLLHPRSLAATRSAFVLQYRANPRAWPDGIGPWYRPDDWLDDGTLIATGEAKAQALDPWANDRAKGRPCPETQRETGEAPVTGAESHDDEPWVAAGVSRATWFRRQKPRAEVARPDSAPRQ